MSIYHAFIGRGSQGAFRLAVSFMRSSNLIISPFLRLEAQERATLNKGAQNTMNTPTTRTPAPLDTELALIHHRSRLIFLHAATDALADMNGTFNINREAVYGLSLILSDLAHDAAAMNDAVANSPLTTEEV